MIGSWQGLLLPIAVFLLVTGLWLRLVLPGEREGRDPGRGGDAKAFVKSLIPAACVGGFGATVWAVTGEAIFATIAFGAGYTLATLLRRGGRRRAEVREIQYALDSIAMANRVLRAGIPLAGMLAMLARDAEGESGRVFRELVRREELGVPIADAIRAVMLESARPELRAFGMALLVHLQVGGNLADTCDRLASSILERGRIRRRCESIVTYGRVAGGVLSVAPFVLVPVLSITIEGYSEFLFDRPIGHALLVVALGMVIVGTFMLQRMTQLMPRQGRVVA